MQFNEVVAKLESFGYEVKQSGEDNQYMSHCPAHEDNRKSLAVKDDNGTAKVFCFAGCTYHEIIRALGVTEDQQFDYRSTDGRLQYSVTKTAGKQFYISTPDGKLGIKGAEKVLYRLGEVLASSNGEPIFICEGETDADALSCLGLISTAHINGANGWKDEYADFLKGRKCVVLPDNDDAGRLHADKVAQSLLGKASEVRVLQLDNLPEHGDISDWLQTGGTIDALMLRVEETTPLSKYIPLRTVGFSSTEEKEIDWFWPNKIPLGVITLLAGDGGMGKSFLSCYFAAMVSNGLEWPDKSGYCPMGTAIFIGDEDDPERIMLPRLRGNNAKTHKVEYIRGYDEITEKSVNLSRDLGSLNATIKEKGDVKLIIIDPITEYLGVQSLNDEEAVRSALTPLARLAEENNLCVLAITHYNKKEGDSFHTRAMGSSAFVHASRSCWGIVKDKDSEFWRCFMPMKQNYCKEPTSLKFRIIDLGGQCGQIEFDESPFIGAIDDYGRDVTAQTKKTEIVKEWITNRLSGGKEVYSNDLIDEAKDAGFTGDQIFNAKRTMPEITATKDSGKNGRWKWSLEEKVLF